MVQGPLDFQFRHEIVRSERSAADLLVSAGRFPLPTRRWSAEEGRNF
jgi:hypothetical protein